MYLDSTLRKRSLLLRYHLSHHTEYGRKLVRTGTWLTRRAQLHVTQVLSRKAIERMQRKLCGGVDSLGEVGLGQ